MEIHLPTRPNVPFELLKYRAGGVLVWLALAVCVLLLSYLIWRIAKVIIAHYRYYQSLQHLVDNLRTTYTKNLQQLEGREFVVALLSYLERYSIHQQYNSLEEMLDQLGIEKQKIEQILLLYYSKRGDELAISNYLKEYLDSI